jgi:HEAT repeats
LPFWSKIYKNYLLTNIQAPCGNAGSLFLRYNKNMNWLTGGAHREAKSLISQWTDVTKRDRAGQDLVKLGADAMPALLEALQTRDANLLPLIRQVIIYIGVPALPSLTHTIQTAPPNIRVQVCDILGQINDRAVLPLLIEASQSEFFAVREGSAHALGNIKDPQSTQTLLTPNRKSVLRHVCRWGNSTSLPYSANLATCCLTIARSKFAKRRRVR